MSAALFATLPSLALAVNRPNWDPGPPWAPLHPHSPEMLQISNLFWEMLVLSAIIFIGVAFVVIYSIFKFSAKPGDGEARQIYGNRFVEISWTAVPFIILVVAFFFTVRSIHDINTPPAGKTPLDVDVIGHQWWWEFQYPSLGVVTANEIHVPTGTPLHFHVESADVVHSFWVPQMQRQIDANPGQDNPVFAEFSSPNSPGVYSGMCYEYCGTAHAWMKFRMVVQTPGDFKAWVRHERQAAVTPTSSLLRRGQYVFLHNTCIDCHAITGTTAGGAVGPNLTHVGSRWTIGAGAAPMDYHDLYEWISDPTQYKPGVNMPGYYTLPASDLKALTSYLLSLK